MQFKIKRPCEHCPFRRDVHPFLDPRRAADLAETLRDDHSWFACHETVGIVRHRRIKKADQSQCAGSMMVLWREGRPNIAMRVAIHFKMLAIQDLAASAPVFDSLAEFARHHGKRR
jgi:hypothetical protein